MAIIENTHIHALGRIRGFLISRLKAREWEGRGRRVPLSSPSAAKSVLAGRPLVQHVIQTATQQLHLQTAGTIKQHMYGFLLQPLVSNHRSDTCLTNLSDPGRDTMRLRTKMAGRISQQTSTTRYTCVIRAIATQATSFWLFRP